MSNLSAHYCPLVRVGSAAPFTAAQAEEGAVAAVMSKTESLAKVDFSPIESFSRSIVKKAVFALGTHFSFEEHMLSQLP